MAPTNRMADASLGKMPTTRDRRLISLLIRSMGLATQIFWRCANSWDGALLAPVGGSRYQQSSGFEVGGVGEAVGGSPQDLQQVVCALDAAVGGPAGVVPGEDLV